MRLLCSLAAGLYVLFMAWAAGYNFDERNGTALFLSMIAPYVGLAVYFVGPWKK